jgi:hypothetical protein
MSATTSGQENARTLASLLGVDEGHAEKLLNVRACLVSDPDDGPAAAAADFTEKLLARTLSGVHRDPRLPHDVQVTFGAAKATRSPHVRASVDGAGIWVGPGASASRSDPGAHQLALLLAACYAAGSALRLLLGGRLSLPGEATFRVPLDAVFGADRSWMARPIALGHAHLAGAGAVGNAFLYAAALLQLEGRLDVVDHDVVGDGNLNRCIWFDRTDVGLLKAERLAERARPHFRNLELVPQPVMLQRLRTEDPRWLQRLIVAVDSRRARRALQGEVPREVFDASTTSVREVVLHHNRQPNAHACMGCVYVEAPDERSRERHVAEMLGVTVGDVQQLVISSDAARKIRERFPSVPLSGVEGNAYDSLFKELCATAALGTQGQHQVFAPFAFVSMLAGVYLATDVARRLTGTAEAFNYWRVSPWSPPVEALKSTRLPDPRCHLCSNETIRSAAAGIWDG